MIPIASPLIGEEEKKAVLDVLNSGMLAQGEVVKQFEEQFADYIGTDYAVAVTNGTEALICALKSLNIKKEVIVPSFSFIASATSIMSVGAKPVFVEVDEKTFNLDPSKLEEKLTDKTEAIMPVHLFGQACEMDKIMEFAKQNNLKVIEDVCQSHGSGFKNQKAGSFGDLGCFSFYPTKNMTTTEGGMITTNDKKLAEFLRLYRNHGMEKRYYHDFEGYNFRMTNLQAAIGLEQLKKLDSFIEKRISNAKFYEKNLSLKGLQKPVVLKNSKHTFNQYTIKFQKRDSLAQHLQKNEIGHAIYYPVPIHKQKIMIDRFGKFPNMNLTDKLCEQVLSIPVHPNLSKEDLNLISETMNNFKL